MIEALGYLIGVPTNFSVLPIWSEKLYDPFEFIFLPSVDHRVFAVHSETRNNNNKEKGECRIKLHVCFCGSCV